MDRLPEIERLLNADKLSLSELREIKQAIENERQSPATERITKEINKRL